MVEIINADVIQGLKQIPDQSVHLVVTSPPYWGLRSYAGVSPRKWDDGSECVFGLEPSLQLYIDHLVEIFSHLKRVLHPTGSFWLNIGDCYDHAGPQPSTGVHRQNGVPLPETFKRAKSGRSKKNLSMVPAKAAIALQDNGWILRQDIIWMKGCSFLESFSGSVMPESIRDRSVWAHEHLFQFALQDKYFYDLEGCKEPYAKSTLKQLEVVYTGKGQKDYESNAVQNPSDVKRRVLESVRKRQEQGLVPDSASERRYKGFNARYAPAGTGRNLRNVWCVQKEPFTVESEKVEWLLSSPCEPFDDMRRKVSPDCPTHGAAQGDVAVRCGEHGALDLIDNRHIDPDLESMPSLDSGRTPGHVSTDRAILREQNSGAIARRHEGAATDHNSETRRMALAPVTTAPYTPSVQREAGTVRTSIAPSSDTIDQNTPVSNISEQVCSDSDTLVEIQDGTDYKSWRDSCNCEYYHKKVTMSSHFATFPTKLVEPVIKLATSEKGACPKCGNQWERVMEKEEIPAHVRQQFEAARGRTTGDTGRTDGYTGRKPNFRRRILGEGWRPTCRCADELGEFLQPVPSVCLDPFTGSGRAGIVAKRLGRTFIGIDASPEYCAIARRVIGEVS